MNSDNISKPIKIALLSPDQKPDSTTFIQAHKKNLKGDISYYYKDWTPTVLEGVGPLFTFWEAIVNLFKNKIGGNRLDYKQQALKKSLAAGNYDVVLAEYGITGANVFPICQNLKIPLVVVFLGMDAYYKPVLEKYELKYKGMFEFAACFIVMSKHMKQKLIKLGCAENKIIISPCAPANMFFGIKNVPDGRNFIAVGRFVEKKSPQTTIKAFNEVLRKYPDARLTMVGNGELWEECKKLIAELKIENAVELPGPLKHEQLMALYAKSIAFVQHSATAGHGDSEGTPVAVLEASAAGLPIVSTFHAGIPDVVIDGETGFLVEENDMIGMAKAMIKIIENKETAIQMGKAGRIYVKENFSMEKHIRIINEVLFNATQSEIRVSGL